MKKKQRRGRERGARPRALESKTASKKQTRMRMDSGAGVARMPRSRCVPKAVAVPETGAEQENIPARYRGTCSTIASTRRRTEIVFGGGQTGCQAKKARAPRGGPPESDGSDGNRRNWKGRKSTNTLGQQAESLAGKSGSSRRKFPRRCGTGEVVDGVLIALLAGGNVLLEGAARARQDMAGAPLAQAVAIVKYHASGLRLILMRPK